jgi:hypothetical protein
MSAMARLDLCCAVPSTSVKREADDVLVKTDDAATQLYVAELEFERAQVYRSLDYTNLEREITVRYQHYQGSSPGGARVMSIRPFLKDMLQEAADRHDVVRFIVRSPPFAYTKDLTSCGPLHQQISYPIPFTPKSFQNAIIDSLTAHPSYIVFRDLGCGTTFLLPQPDSKRVRYENL